MWTSVKEQNAYDHISSLSTEYLSFYTFEFKDETYDTRHYL